MRSPGLSARGFLTGTPDTSRQLAAGSWQEMRIDAAWCKA
jgi:hypothetical protein